MQPPAQAARGRGKRRKDKLRQTPPARPQGRRHWPCPRLGDQCHHPRPAAHLGGRGVLRGRKPNEADRSATVHRTASKRHSGLPPLRPARRPHKDVRRGGRRLHRRGSAAGHGPSEEDDDRGGDGGGDGGSAAPATTAAASSDASIACATCVAAATATAPSSGPYIDERGGLARRGAGAGSCSAGLGGRD